LIPVVLSPQTAYATKDNIRFPGTQAQATAAEALAQTRINQVLPNGLTVTVPGGAIKIAT
jgi:hypothetical protein